MSREDALTQEFRSSNVSNDFRDLLYDVDHPRLADARARSVRNYSDALEEIPMPRDLRAYWRSLAKEPFHGLTCDGTCETGLYTLADEGAPVEQMVAAARRLLDIVSPDQEHRLRHGISSPAWRLWSNPEFLWNDNGLRLDECPDDVRDAVLAVLAASMSTNGYEKARGCMQSNAFLGELTQLQHIMNEFSYNFVLYGEPSADRPWGWNLYGHHLALNCFILKRQMVISPTFMGAEPNLIDTGPNAGLKMFVAEETNGLALMRSLAPGLRDKAQLWPAMVGDTLPAGRFHPADGFHLGGAFQDNRVVPQEGICAADLDRSQRGRLIDLMATFVEYLPSSPLAARLRQFEQHLDRTYWSWIGGYGDADPFYYRIQSPVAMMEFDHHLGIWLTNSAPAKCHIHTVVRTPNGNDYGMDLLKKHLNDAHVVYDYSA